MRRGTYTSRRQEPHSTRAWPIQTKTNYTAFQARYSDVGLPRCRVRSCSRWLSFQTESQDTAGDQGHGRNIMGISCFSEVSFDPVKSVSKAPRLAQAAFALGICGVTQLAQLDVKYRLL